MSWTDDRVALLKKLWGEGKTAAEIAKELGGVTRNAVIGKAHRLKLSNRVSPIQQNKKPAPVKTPANTQSPPATSAKKKAQLVREADDKRTRIPLTALQNGQCRWPLGDPREKNFGFCGAEGLPGLPYCLEHSQSAYQPATRNRILKDQAVHKEVAAEEVVTEKKVVSQ